jgi:hypothetical protein
MGSHPTVAKLLAGSGRTHERKTMKFSLTTKLAAASGLTALLLGGLVAPVAQADPIANGSKSLYGLLSGVGSDTTQDVMNGLQIAIGRVSTNGDWRLASYDANAAGTIKTKSNGTAAICRPNGSGNGLKALNVAIGADDAEACTPFSGDASTWSTVAGATSVVGQIQYSRSSSGPTVGSDGVVAYVPFAKDAMGYAVSDDSVMPELTVGTSTDAANGSGVTPSSLWAIYNCAATRIITVDGDLDGSETKLVDNTYTLGSGEESTRIRAYLPQSGSGTADFWQGKSGAKFGIGSTVANCVERKAFVAGDAGDVDGGNNTFTSSADYTGISVQEHSGQAVQGNPGAITPFSIPKWIAMAKAIPGVTDVRYDVVIGTLNGIAPTSGSGSNLVINPDYITDSNTSYVTRTVYNVVPYRLVTDPTTLEHAMFRGRTSLVCSNTAAIQNYGFAALTANSGINSCGDTSQRAVTGSTPSVSTTTATLDNANSETDFAVTGFTSNGTAGAKVYVLATSTVDSTNTFYANEATPATIDAGATGTTFSLPYSALPSGSWKLGLVIVPNLPGILSISSANNLATKSGATTTLSATVTGKVKKFGKAVITVATSSGTPTGTVTVHKGTSAAGAVIGMGTLTAGTVTITNLTKQKKKGKVKLFIVYSGDGSYAASTKAVTWNVK